jgi:hypothetical protein
MSHDYGIYYRCELNGPDDWQALPHWDFFVSSFNRSERIRTVYDRINATQKLWVIHREYNLDSDEHPPEESFYDGTEDESIFCKNLIAKLVNSGGFDPAKHRLCIDITGIVRPHLMFLMKLLQTLGIRTLDAFYAEPLQYASKENTSFSGGHMLGVRPVRGFEGSPVTDGDDDFLIVGMGYDDRLLAAVAENKEKADKHQLFGLPSLRADMYQESVLRSRRAADEIGDPNFAEQNRSFAPANDPFGTAAVLSELVSRRLSTSASGNVILTPLGTKAQVLGFTLFFIHECNGLPASIIFPFSSEYAPETSTGLARAWHYQIEF